MDKLRLEYLRIDELNPTKENAKEHDLQTLSELFYEHGFKVPLVIWENKNQILAGHGRTKTLLMLMGQGKTPPRGILIDTKDDMWLVPCILGLDPDSLEGAFSFLIDDNNATMVGGAFTSLDVSRMWDREGYIELLKLAGNKVKTVDADDLALLIKVDQMKENPPEILPEPDEKTEKDVIRYNLIFSTIENKNLFIDWVTEQRELNPEVSSGDNLLEFIS